MNTITNNYEETNEPEEVNNSNIGLQALSSEEEDVSGGQLGGLKEDGDNVVPDEKDSLQTAKVLQSDEKATSART